MAAALTGSQTLYQIAQQKYLITDEEKKQAKEEIHFKKYVVSSISTLSRQVALIESIVEKNSLMINAIYNDLGYFKGQRKLNPLTSYSGIKTFRVPVSSRTVKGRIDIINAEIAALKGIRLAAADSKQKAAAKDVELKEKDKRKGLIAAAVTSALAGAGLLTVGAGAGVAALGASVAGIAGGAVASQIGKQIVGSAIPIIGKAFKVSLLGTVALGAAGRIKRRGENMAGVQLGGPEDYKNNYDPRKDPINFQIRQNEIELRKAVDNLLEEFSKPIDSALIAITTFLAAKYTGEFLEYMSDKSVKLPKGKIGKALEKILPGAMIATSATAAAASSGTLAATVGGIGAAAYGSKIASGTIAGNRIRVGGMWKTIPTAATPPTATKVPKLPAKIQLFLKGLSGAKGVAKFLKGPGALAAGGTLLYLANLYSSMGKYSDPPSQEFKESFISNVSGLLSTGGATLVAGGLGLAVGGVPGLLVGGTAGLVTGMLSEGATMAIASTIFDLLFDQPTGATSGMAVGGGSMQPSTLQGSAEQAVQFFVDRGYGQDVAAAIVGNLVIESNLKPDAVGDGGKAYGIAQWHPDRQANFQRVYGKPIQQASFEEQLMFVDWELNNTERAAKEKIMMAAASGGTGAAAAAVDKFYERSKGLHTAQRVMVANQLYEGSYSGAMPSVGTAEGSRVLLAGSGLGSMLDAQIFDLIGRDFSNVETLRTAEQAAAVDNNARASVAQLTEVVITAQKKNVEQISAVAAAAQQLQDQKNLDTMPYVDDRAFDEDFSNLAKILPNAIS